MNQPGASILRPITADYNLTKAALYEPRIF